MCFGLLQGCTSYKDHPEPAEETIAKFSPEIPEAAETKAMKGWERFNAKFLIITYVLKGFIT